MIVRFHRDQFECALPTTTKWIGLGVVGGEHCYFLPVKEGVGIYIRSSVAADGIAADAAEDSIRCWLAADEKGEPLGSKDQRWIARTNGWDRRLIETLRTLWRVGKKLGKCNKLIRRPVDGGIGAKVSWAGKKIEVALCGGQMLALKVKRKGSSNLGRWFTSCSVCGQFGDWLTEPKQLELTAQKESKQHA